MSFLKNILSPFMEFKNDEGQETTGISAPGANTKSAGKQTTATGYATPALQTPSASTSATSATVGEYEKYFEHLIEEANAKNPLFQGTDFKEFIDSKTDVEAIADEATKYKTAFNVLKRTGLTKDRLVSTGQEYIRLIDTDLTGFNSAYAQQYKSDVEQKEQLLQKKAEELQALNEKITAVNNDIKQLSQQIVQSKDKLNTNKDLFVRAGQNKKQEIQSELQKIEQYF